MNRTRDTEPHCRLAALLLCCRTRKHRPGRFVSLQSTTERQHAGKPAKQDGRVMSKLAWRTSLARPSRSCAQPHDSQQLCQHMLLGAACKQAGAAHRLGAAQPRAALLKLGAHKLAHGVPPGRAPARAAAVRQHPRHIPASCKGGPLVERNLNHKVLGANARQRVYDCSQELPVLQK